MENIKTKLQSQFEEDLFINNFNLTHDKKMLENLVEESKDHVVKMTEAEEELKNFPADDKTKETRDLKKEKLRAFGLLRKNVEMYNSLKEKLEASISMAERKSRNLKDKLEFLATYNPDVRDEK